MKQPMEVWHIFVAIVPAFLIFILLFLEVQLTEEVLYCICRLKAKHKLLSFLGYNEAGNHLTFFVILYLYSDRIGKKIIHHFLYSQ